MHLVQALWQAFNTIMRPQLAAASNDQEADVVAVVEQMLQQQAASSNGCPQLADTDSVAWAINTIGAVDAHSDGGLEAADAASWFTFTFWHRLHLAKHASTVRAAMDIVQLQQSLMASHPACLSWLMCGVST